MNKINPIWFSTLLLVLVFTSYLQKNRLLNTLNETSAKAHVTLENIQSIHHIKQQWSFKQNTLNAIVNQFSIEGISIKQEELKNKYLISFEKVPITQLKPLVNKLLNSSLAFSKISLTKNSNTMSVTIEIEK